MEQFITILSLTKQKNQNSTYVFRINGKLIGQQTIIQNVSSQIKIHQLLQKSIDFIQFWKKQKTKTGICINNKSLHYQQIKNLKLKQIPNLILIPWKQNQKKCNLIYYFDRQLGGGCLPFSFNSLQKELQVKFSNQAPKWRILKKGLNLQGQCQNNDFKAYKKRVWIPKGYGNFNMNKQVYSSNCPMCSECCTDVSNLGIYMASFFAKGKIKGQKQQRIMRSEHNNIDDFLTYENKDQSRRDWLYLQLKIQQIKK